MVLKYSITPSTYFGFLTSLMILKFLWWQKQRTAEFELKTQAFVSSVLIMRAKMVEMGLQREKVERMERCKTARSVLLNDASSCGISKVWEFLLHAHYIKSISYKKWHKNRRRQKVALSNPYFNTLPLLGVGNWNRDWIRGLIWSREIPHFHLWDDLKRPVRKKV